MSRYGVRWPDGTFTGGIGFSYRELTEYARSFGGRVYEVGADNDPEVNPVGLKEVRNEIEAWDGRTDSAS